MNRGDGPYFCWFGDCWAAGTDKVMNMRKRRLAAGPGGVANRALKLQADADVSFLAMADLRLAAWFLWMTPLLTALSSLRDASRISTAACSASPAVVASLNLRTSVFSSDLTDLFRSRRFSFCRL